jgi:hypothetical protein
VIARIYSFNIQGDRRMGIQYSDLIRRGLIPAGRRKIVRLGKDRYLVYLPRSLNYVWKELRSRGAKVRVYIEIDVGSDDVVSSDG